MPTARRRQPFGGAASWEGRTLRDDLSWTVRLTDAHRAEIASALAHFVASTRAKGLTAQWLHGYMVPAPDDFPLPTLGPVLRQVRVDLEEGRGLALLKGFPVRGFTPKELHLVHAGLSAHVGTPRPQTVFGEHVQDITNVGQAHLQERRGSKHNRPLGFHNDPSDVVSFLCVHPALSGGDSLFASAQAVHDEMVASAPEHVATLYRDFVHTWQEYLYVRTGSNDRLVPKARTYRMPTFTEAGGRFACKYSRFYIDEAQQVAGVPPLTERQRAALDAWEARLADERWHLRLRYEPGDVMFINNFTCLHARTAFEDGGGARRHLQRIWLSMPNSRPLSRHWKRQVFFRRVEAGAVRGGVSIPPISHG